jgi:Domain of unknown function (DUF1905)
MLLASDEQMANHLAMPRPKAPSHPDDPALADFLRSELGLEEDGASTTVAWSHSAPVWIWRGSGNGPPPKAAWYFLTIDGDTAAAIRAAATGRTNGFGSVRVTATIGRTSWQTSLFPSKDSGGYLLPLKASVRRAESLDGGKTVTVTLTLA